MDRAKPTRIVGVSNMLSHLGRRTFPKRELLYFDHIAIVALQEGIEAFRQSGKTRYAQHADNLEWLVQQGLISEHDPQKHSLSESARKELARGVETSQEAERFWQAQRAAREASGIDFSYGLAQEGLHLSFDSNAYWARAAAAQLQSSTVDAVPLISPRELTRPDRVTSAEIIHITLQQVPVPADSVPFQDIVAFQSAPETREHVIALRRWARKLEKEGHTAVEAAQEIEHLVHEYDRYMTIQKLKHSTGVVEFAIVTIADAFESAVKLQFGSLAKSFFQLSRERAELLEAEAKAPGREVAFLIHSRAAVAGLSQ
jgi:hypothetical protein